MKRRKAIGLVAALVTAFVVLGFADARAAQIVSWGPSASYVDADTNMPAGTDENEAVSGIDRDGDGATDDRVTYVAFSTSTPLNPSSGYSGPTFYGGYLYTHPTAFADDRRKLLNDEGSTSGRPNDAIYGFQGNRNGTEVRFIVAFDQSGFLNGGDSRRVSFDTGASFVFDNGTNEGYYGVNDVRAMVRNGGQWYVHENDAGGTLNFDPSAARWASVSLVEGQTDLLLEYPSTFDAGNSVLGSTLTDITGVAMYFDMDDRSKFSMEQLSVDATIVPEPGSVVVVAGVFLSMLLRRWRIA
mgnify:CR=1 FL=1